jgi:hypothetical protein
MWEKSQLNCVGSDAKKTLTHLTRNSPAAKPPLTVTGIPPFAALFPRN